MRYPPTPAERLDGVTLDTGWKVVRRLGAPADATGGNFSVRWLVERDGQTAFLKAIDIHKTLRRNPGKIMAVLQAVSTAYNYECDLLQACGDRSMDRVVRAIDKGEYLLDKADPASVVFYLIFDLAEGDIRAAHDASVQLDLGRIFRALHDIAVGIRQLHGAQISHQDVKPSNVLTFEEEREIARLADLGRASVPSAAMRHDRIPFAGDPAHATPEGLYGTAPPDWDGRRACDLYHLGSMLLFLFTGVGATAAWHGRLAPGLSPQPLGGPYAGSYSDVMPYVRDALQKVCEDFPQFGDDRVRAVALSSFRELCESDPNLRGHPKAHGRLGDRYSVERYIALFDLESRRTYRQVAKKRQAA